MAGSFTCPVDGAKLQPMERQGIEIDFCPDCRGVWLDRGELDKILERSAAPAAAPEAAQPAAQKRSALAEALLKRNQAIHGRGADSSSEDEIDDDEWGSDSDDD